MKIYHEAGKNDAALRKWLGRKQMMWGGRGSWGWRLSHANNTSTPIQSGLGPLLLQTVTQASLQTWTDVLICSFQRQQHTSLLFTRLLCNLIRLLTNAALLLSYQITETYWTHPLTPNAIKSCNRKKSWSKATITTKSVVKTAAWLQHQEWFIFGKSLSTPSRWTKRQLNGGICAQQQA